MSSSMQTPTPLPVPDAALFACQEERDRIETWLSKELAAVLPRIRSGPVTPTLDTTQFRERLKAFDFNRPIPLQEVLRWVLDTMEHGIVQMSNPRYFGLFNPGPHFPAQCADRVTSLFNPQLASSASSPAPVALENHVIRAFAQLAGLPAEAVGHFANGGSEANYTALICALGAGHPGFSAEGARAYAGAPTFYASRDCHIAWLKIAHQAGIGRNALRLIETDGHGRLDAGKLITAIREDRARGAVPVMLVATAGTTGAGMIDPLHACAEIARRERLWYHIDAAWGGGALVSDRLRSLLVGAERADSITIDAHKWLATTMGCAMFITRKGSELSAAFHASASFMPSSVADGDPYLNSVQWSRRFLGLRLFVALAAAGWEGIGSHVERSVAVVERIRVRLLAMGWTIANNPLLAVLAVRPPAHLGEVKAIVRRVVAAGQVWVAQAVFEGHDVIRICATHGEATLDDVDLLVNALNQSP